MRRSLRQGGVADGEAMTRSRLRARAASLASWSGMMIVLGADGVAGVAGVSGFSCVVEKVDGVPSSGKMTRSSLMLRISSFFSGSVSWLFDLALDFRRFRASGTVAKARLASAGPGGRLARAPRAWQSRPRDCRALLATVDMAVYVLVFPVSFAVLVLGQLASPCCRRRLLACGLW